MYETPTPALGHNQDFVINKKGHSFMYLSLQLSNKFRAHMWQLKLTNSHKLESKLTTSTTCNELVTPICLHYTVIMGLRHPAAKIYGKSTADILSYWEELTTKFLSNNKI